MKKIILIIFCAILFASCTGVETSVFSTDKVANTDYSDSRPFVVDKKIANMLLISGIILLLNFLLLMLLL